MSPQTDLFADDRSRVMGGLRLTEPLPRQRHSKTSQDAANSISESRAEQDRQKILRYLRMSRGATDSMLQTALIMDGNTERPRRIELLKRGDIRDSGRRHRTASGREAVVWEAT